MRKIVISRSGIHVRRVIDPGGTPCAQRLRRRSPRCARRGHRGDRQLRKHNPHSNVGGSTSQAVIVARPAPSRPPNQRIRRSRTVRTPPCPAPRRRPNTAAPPAAPITQTRCGAGGLNPRWTSCASPQENSATEPVTLLRYAPRATHDADVAQQQLVHLDSRPPACGVRPLGVCGALRRCAHCTHGTATGATRTPGGCVPNRSGSRCRAAPAALRCRRRRPAPTPTLRAAGRAQSAPGYREPPRWRGRSSSRRTAESGPAHPDSTLPSAGPRSSPSAPTDNMSPGRRSPPSGAATPEPCSRSCRQQALGDVGHLDLVAAGVDHQRLGVACQLFDAVFGHITVASE